MAAQDSNIYAEPNDYEAADTALRGALALGVVLRGDDGYAKTILDDLHGAQSILLHNARERLDALNSEHWTACALLGRYGPDAKARAEQKQEARA